MSRPISFECSQNGCEEFGVASDSGVLFDVQSLFEGKRLTNTQTQVCRAIGLPCPAGF